MRKGLRLWTLMHRSADVDLSLLERGFDAVCDALTVDGTPPMAFVGQLESGALFLRVLSADGAAWRRTCDVWRSVADGSVCSYRVRNAAVLDVLAGCKSLVRQASSS